MSGPCRSCWRIGYPPNCWIRWVTSTICFHPWSHSIKVIEGHHLSPGKSAGSTCDGGETAMQLDILFNGTPAQFGTAVDQLEMTKRIAGEHPLFDIGRAPSPDTLQVHVGLWSM